MATLPPVLTSSCGGGGGGGGRGEVTRGERRGWREKDGREEERISVVLNTLQSSLETSVRKLLMACYLCNLLVVEEAGVVEWCVAVLIGGIGVYPLVLQQLTQAERRGGEGEGRGGEGEEGREGGRGEGKEGRERRGRGGREGEEGKEAEEGGGG